MGRQTMRVSNSISGNEAECYVTIDGNRYNFMTLINFEATMDVDNIDVPMLGARVKQHKAGKINIEWKGEKHYNDSIMRMLVKRYKDTGIMDGFEIQVTNDDPNSLSERQTVILTGCITKGGILTQFNESEDNLTEEISGTANGFEMPETFKTPMGV